MMQKHAMTLIQMNLMTNTLSVRKSEHENDKWSKKKTKKPNLF